MASTKPNTEYATESAVDRRLWSIGRCVVTESIPPVTKRVLSNVEPIIPPRRRYTTDRILSTALQLVRTSGIDAVSARAVARELGCSTAPVFRCFESMDALHEAVLDRILAQFVDATESARDPDPLFAAGLGMVLFAAEEPRFYEALFLRPHAWTHKWGPVRKRLAARMATHPRYAHLPAADRFGLVGRASILAHGLGVEVWFGRLPDPSVAVLRSLLHQLADPMVEAALVHGWTTDIHSLRSSPSSSTADVVAQCDPGVEHVH